MTGIEREKHFGARGGAAQQARAGLPGHGVQNAPGCRGHGQRNPGRNSLAAAIDDKVVPAPVIPSPDELEPRNPGERFRADAGRSQRTHSVASKQASRPESRAPHTVARVAEADSGGE